MRKEEAKGKNELVLVRRLGKVNISQGKEKSYKYFDTYEGLGDSARRSTATSRHLGLELLEDLQINSIPFHFPPAANLCNLIINIFSHKKNG